MIKSRSRHGWHVIAPAFYMPKMFFHSCKTAGVAYGKKMEGIRI